MVARRPPCPACRRLERAVGEARWQVLEAWFDGIVAAHDPEPPLHGALRTLREVISTDRASLVTAMPEDRLRVVASSDLRSTGDLVISLERYPELQTVLRTGQPFRAEDVRSSEVLAPVLDTLEHLGVVSLMAIPVTLDTVPMVFRLLSASRHYGEADEQLALSAAHLLQHAASRPAPPGAAAAAWKTLVAKLSDCVVEVLPNGRIATIEGRTGELFGRTPSELVGSQAADLFRTLHSASPGRHLFRLLETLRESGDASQIATLQTVSGSTAQVSLCEVPGTLVPRVFMAVRRLQGDGQLTLEDLPVPAILLRNTTIVASNQRAAALLRGSPDPLPEELFRSDGTILRLRGPGGTQSKIQALSQALQSQSERLVVLVDAGPQSKTLRTVEALRASLAQHMRAAEAAQHRMEQLETLKSRFLASSAHELKTPLTVLQSYLEILSTDLAEGLNEEQLSFLDIAYRNVLRLRRLVLDLTDLAAFEGGQILVEIRRVRVGPVVSRVVEDMLPLSRDAGLELSMEVPADLPDLRADPSRVEQVLHNLIDNAVKYTPSGGSVRVTARTAGDSVALEIHDTGIGIPPGQEAAIFEPFVRAENPGIHPEGSGLGLTISRRIMSALGGRLSVVSTPGEGSVFRIQLPIWPEDEAPNE